MAKYVTFERSQYGILGLIPLKRGDDWRLQAQVINKAGTGVTPIDLTGATIEAFFKPESDDAPCTGAVTVVQATEGRIQLDVAATGSILADLADEGVSMHLSITGEDGRLERVDSLEAALLVVDQSFDEP